MPASSFSLSENFNLKDGAPEVLHFLFVCTFVFAVVVIVVFVKSRRGSG